MFDMGFAEMVIIAIVALVVIGPERLPTVARKAGAYVARIRRFVSNVKSDVEREFRTDELQRMLQQQQDELQSLKEVVKDSRRDTDLGSIEKSVNEAVDAVRDESGPSSVSQDEAAKTTETSSAKTDA